MKSVERHVLCSENMWLACDGPLIKLNFVFGRVPGSIITDWPERRKDLATNFPTDT